MTQLSELNIKFSVPIVLFVDNIPRLTFDPGLFVEPSFSAIYKIALSYSVLIFVLLVRPYGLFGEKPSGDR